MPNLIPAGTSDQSSDAARQSGAALWFNSIEGLLSGIDDSMRVSQANEGSQVLGFGTSLGVDIGVGQNGDAFVRGRLGGTGGQAPTNGQAAPRGFRITPAMLLLALGAFLILRK